MDSAWHTPKKQWVNKSLPRSASLTVGARHKAPHQGLWYRWGIGWSEWSPCCIWSHRRLWTELKDSFSQWSCASAESLLQESFSILIENAAARHSSFHNNWPPIAFEDLKGILSEHTWCSLFTKSWIIFSNLIDNSLRNWLVKSEYSFLTSALSASNLRFTSAWARAGAPSSTTPNSLNSASFTLSFARILFIAWTPHVSRK